MGKLLCTDWTNGYSWFHTGFKLQIDLFRFRLIFIFFYLYRKSWYVSIVQIIGPVLDVAFPPGKMPKLYNALVVEGIDSMGLPIPLRCDLLVLLGDNRILAIARANLSLYRRIKGWNESIWQGSSLLYWGADSREYLRSSAKGYTSLISVYGAFCKPLVGVESSTVSIITLQ